MTSIRPSVLLTILASSIFLVGCGSTARPIAHDAPPEKAPVMNGMQPQPPAELTDEQSSQVKAGETTHEPTSLTFNITGGSFYFTPNAIKVKKGDKVKIIFTNAGGMHNLMLDEFQVKMDPIKTGETTSVEFIADKAGTFEYYCGVGKHRQMGQKGTLVVEE